MQQAPGPTASSAPLLRVRDHDNDYVRRLEQASLSIGRDDGCDLVLAHQWLDPVAVVLEARGGSHRVVIAGDPDAVLFGGRPVSGELVLHDGDTLRLTDKTTGGYVSLTYLNPLARPIAAVQHFATPPGVAVLTIGRAGADIVLDQPLVSRRHAELLWRDDHHVLVDCDSAHGTHVNGTLVDQVRLQPGDVVQIGTFRLTYDGDSLDTLDQRGDIRIDVRELRRVVGGSRPATILHDTSLSIEPCEFVGIVGASGAGKSTLLTTLCGFQPASGGRVTLNGAELRPSDDGYRSMLGYVPQDDIVHHTLVVERALRYTARLRLPADTSEDEIRQRIDAVLAAVEMTEHRGKRIDQLSGGQRKRVSIASELLADCSLLFLDEPTSGLDPGLERKMMFTLRTLADSGRIVLLITHATANIEQCDHIVFMAGGRVIYFGPPFQALAFFGAETFADIYTRTEGAADPESALVKGELAGELAAWRSANPHGGEPSLAELWELRFRDSLQHAKYIVERGERGERAADTSSLPADEHHGVRGAVRTRLRHVRVLTRRYVELIAADRRNLALLLLQAPVIGALLVLVSRPDSLTTGGRFQAKKITFMLATIGVWFGVINAAREICKESTVFRRERLAGVRPSSYLLSKLGVLSLLVVIQSALLLAVVFLRLEPPATGVMLPAMVELFITLTLAGLAGIALGLCISAVASTPDKATSLIPIVLVPQVIFAGLVFRMSGITELLSRLTASRWAMDALSATADTNNMPERIALPLEPQYAATAANLGGAWAALALQTIAFSVVAWLLIRWRR